MDTECQAIFELSCEKGFRAIIDEARWQMQAEPDKLTDFIETLSALPNHYHRTMVTYLDHPECWKGATDGRFWHVVGIVSSAAAVARQCGPGRFGIQCDG